MWPPTSPCICHLAYLFSKSVCALHGKAPYNLLPLPKKGLLNYSKVRLQTLIPTLNLIGPDDIATASHIRMDG